MSKKRDFYYGILLGTVMSICGNIWVNFIFNLQRGMIREDIWYGVSVPTTLVLATIGLLYLGWMLWNEAKKSGNE